MTDKEKLDAIRAEIHRLVDVRGYDREMANDLFAFMDSLSNKPVSADWLHNNVWHKPYEKPFDKSKVVVWIGDEMVQCHYMYGKFKEKNPTEECGYNVDIKSCEGCGNVYVSKKKRADLTDLVEKWAYIDDVLNLSNVERTEKNWKEEHVSEDLEEACEQLAENERKHKAETSSPFFSQTDYKQGVMDGAKWQKEHQQAEKYLALTWEDMRELYIIFAEVDTEIELCKTDIKSETIGYYQEVLKRFKNLKK